MHAHIYKEHGDGLHPQVALVFKKNSGLPSMLDKGAARQGHGRGNDNVVMVVVITVKLRMVTRRKRG
jgi:hypothetical protein